MVLICKRFQISDKARAFIVNAVLKNNGVFDQQGMTFIVDRSKLKRESRNTGKDEEESVLFAKVDGFYIDGKKDATLVTTEKGVQHQQVYMRNIMLW